jgi:hypothetical protein
MHSAGGGDGDDDDGRRRGGRHAGRRDERGLINIKLYSSYS